MMRLKDKFKQLKKEGKKAFIAYVPFGFPSIKSTRSICLKLQEAGVDAIEIGVPFSDPLADGPIIQKATTQALNKGANLDNFFKEVSKFKDKIRVPIVIMSYYNPIFKFGLDNFFKKIKFLGITAITIVDLPLEESNDYIKKARFFGIDTVFFVTPTTSNKRITKIVRQSRGFIYYISVTGITGPKDFNYKPIASHIKKVNQAGNISVCVGFGIHTREQVEKINKFSDGVIVGSEIVKFIEKNCQRKDFLDKLKIHIKSLMPLS